MKIIGGKHRGRVFKSLHGQSLRPTAARTREAVFNIIEHGIDGPPPAASSVADVFAGAGSLGLEALSRGAASVVFIDNNENALACCRENVAALGEQHRSTLLRLDALHPPPPPLAAKTPCAYVFLDPPYNSGLAAPALGALFAEGWIGEGSICVVETAAKEPFEAPEGFKLIDERTYGAAKVTFLKMARNTILDLL
ncbi:MAG: 16S rRNA (guanine(966)-N(2))-methyltransferase RsmD [Rhodospirillales bacterium RIFCSPLOWO2_12_FULL_58_28]|nr:MAG: 16S rRNA (guanine(966)-N(2))-methyltransferase RsmD [Rhodospirillales bacterium RIFCSPLOWO2_02_FULL_58_16]OHC76751.1 MAG: 16S rRNA (guanine(966)-N(2))-methyltransferase RsmD [Rhodospirillales bacterium RIFCSPLOWO2_12_FULL_58_28]